MSTPSAQEWAERRAELQDARSWMLEHAPDTLADVIATVDEKIRALEAESTDDTEAKKHDDGD